MAKRNSSTDFYNEKRAKLRNEFFFTYRSPKKDTTRIFLKKIVNHLKPGGKILDIGTGNGFVAKNIALLCRDKNIKLYGVDISAEMVKIAKKETSKFKNIKILRADNFSLPFKEKYFDIVTNKVVTNFSAKEVYRVLKEEGWFIFKEYGKWKGLKEITSLFPERVIRAYSPLKYIKELYNSGFKNIYLDQFIIPMKYTYQEIVTILNIAPIIEDFSEKDAKTLESILFNKNKERIIYSDPFIIQAFKAKLK